MDASVKNLNCFWTWVYTYQKSSMKMCLISFRSHSSLSAISKSKSSIQRAWFNSWTLFMPSMISRKELKSFTKNSITSKIIKRITRMLILVNKYKMLTMIAIMVPHIKTSCLMTISFSSIFTKTKFYWFVSIKKKNGRKKKLTWKLLEQIWIKTKIPNLSNVLIFRKIPRRYPKFQYLLLIKWSIRRCRTMKAVRI